MVAPWNMRAKTRETMLAMQCYMKSFSIVILYQPWSQSLFANSARDHVTRTSSALVPFTGPEFIDGNSSIDSVSM